MNWKLTRSQECALVVKEANGILGHIKKSTASAPLPFLCPGEDYCIQFWAVQLKKDRDLLERVQPRATKIITGLEHLLYEERL